ncbi:MAG TPA: ORF6N domain-containing protein [bacterium]|nr:ORF6N domain-containing protein [bacterium]
MSAYPSVEQIHRRILVLRGRRVILDADLAELYGVSTKQLNQQLSRNKSRFPEDFVFKINAEEKKGGHNL